MEAKGRSGRLKEGKTECMRNLQEERLTRNKSQARIEWKRLVKNSDHVTNRKSCEGRGGSTWLC